MQVGALLVHIKLLFHFSLIYSDIPYFLFIPLCNPLLCRFHSNAGWRTTGTHQFTFPFFLNLQWHSLFSLYFPLYSATLQVPLSAGWPTTGTHQVTFPFFLNLQWHSLFSLYFPLYSATLQVPLNAGWRTTGTHQVTFPFFLNLQWLSLFSLYSSPYSATLQVPLAVPRLVFLRGSTSTQSDINRHNAGTLFRS